PFVPGEYVLPFAAGLGAWSSSIVGMAIGLVLTVGVSAVTTATAGENVALYEGLSAD
ncbi:MAG: SSS family solute:Na+ symporter, partial [Haloarculaceae archaeon]